MRVLLLLASVVCLASATVSATARHASWTPAQLSLSEQRAAARANGTALRYQVGWFGPFWSGTGYSSEALNYVLSMVRSKAVREQDIWIAHHGDNDRSEVRNAMEEFDRRQLTTLERNVNKSHPAVIVCHSLPTNWVMPSPMGWAGAACPPDPREYAYVYTIGRTMFETDRLPASFVPRCNMMNEIWVPSDFSKEVFIRSGVPASKLRVVPEGVNTTHMDPGRYTPIPMPQGELVFGSAAGRTVSYVASSTDTSSRDGPRNVESVRVVRKQASPGSPAAAASSPGPATTQLNPGAGPLQQQQQKVSQQSVGDASPQRQADEMHNRGGPAKASGEHSSSGTSGGVLGQLMEKLSGGKHGSGDKTSAAPSEQASARPVSEYESDAESEAEAGSEEQVEEKRPFRFLSSFKWEPRKGWDVLLEAYLAEFTHEDDVELIIITKPFVGGSDYKRQMHMWAERSARQRWDQQRKSAPPPPPPPPPQVLATSAPIQVPRAPPGQDTSAPQQVALPVPHQPETFVFNASLLPRLYVVAHHISDADLPRFYKAVDAFVLPSRGEGWGRPHVEAMSMGLPVISTNWSGITAYLDDDVGYPLAIDGLVPADPAVWWFRGLHWAQPSVSHLRKLMRRVYEQRDEAKAKGAAARRRMIDQYGPDAIGKLMAEEFQRVERLIPR